MTDERIIILERRVDDVKSTVTRMDDKLDNITDALASLVRIEERQINANEKLNNGALKFDDHEARIRNVEKEIPPLVESRKWRTMAMLAGLGMVAAAVVKLVLINP